MKTGRIQIFMALLALAAGCSSSEDENDTLLNLEISQGALSPSFVPEQTSYTADELFYVETVTLTPTAADPKAAITVEGQSVLSGMGSQVLTLSAGANPFAVELTTPSGKVKHYDVVVTRGSSLEYFKADHTVAGAYFGASVSLSGDTLAVGAIDEDLNGAVYVFSRSGSTWMQQARLTPANTGGVAYGFIADSFGNSVSISGNTLAVGARGEDSGATGVDGDEKDDSAPDSGAVYVFQRTGTQWTQEAYLKASNTDSSDYFGCAVSLSGDTLAIGAYEEDSSASGVNGNQDNQFDSRESGAVYVFERSQGQWTQQAYLKALDVSSNDFFGWSVSLSNDTLAVGAIGEDSDGTADNRNAQASGAVYVFVRSQESWTQQTRLKADHPHEGDRFGTALSLSEDTIAIGADHEDSNAPGGNGLLDDQAQDSGAVYVFTRDKEMWTQQAFLKASNAGADDLFGGVVSLAGDRLAVGAYQESSIGIGLSGQQADDNASQSGAVYIFTRSGSSWTPRTYVKAPNTGAGDHFGASVSLDGDSLAVGAFGESSSAVGVGGDEANDDAPVSGAVYLYQ